MKCSPADAHDADVAIYLNYGIDCSLGYFGDLVISERGIIFRSRWRFSLGTQLALRVCAQGQGVEEYPVCEELTGLVVSCEPYYGRSRLFEVTVLFLDVPEPVQLRIGRLATRPELMGNLN
ncbi:MAG: hypothetical protein WB586_21335 [Chthoniobacterales bacterium]